jgi:hypothetical protein
MFLRVANPLRSVLTPFVVPFSRRVDPINTSLFSLSNILAVKVFCALVIVEKATSNRVSIFLSFLGMQM